MPTDPAAPESLDSLIASMANEPNDSPSVDDAGNVTTEAESTAEDGEVTEPADPPAPASPFDGAKLAAAAEKKDLKALIEALGPAADELLGGKAHKVLRLQLKEAEQKVAEADRLSKALEEKYADPIAARKGAEAGTAEGFDQFVSMLEKWSGMSWNDTMKWAAKHIAGKGEPLPKHKAEEKNKADDTAKAEREKAMKETRDWVSSSLASADEKFIKACPEVVDLVIDEIRSGLAKGVDTPKKALPLAKAKLKTQYERLHAYFGGRKPGPKPKEKEEIAAAANGATGGNARTMTLEELIAETKREAGVQ